MDLLKKHVQSYNYVAAIQVVKELTNPIKKEAKELLLAAHEREQLDLRAVSKRKNKIAYQIFPVQESSKCKLVEYYLTLDLKIKRKEYADFIRAISPLILDVMENVLQQQCGIDVNTYLDKNKSGMRFWNMNKVGRDGRVHDLLNQTFNRGFEGGNIKAIHISKMIQAFATDQKVKDEVGAISIVEQKARNLAAHEIISVTDEWIIEQTGKSARQIQNSLRFLLTKAGIAMTNEIENSYDSMNVEIVRLLQ